MTIKLEQLIQQLAELEKDKSCSALQALAEKAENEREKALVSISAAQGEGDE